MRNFHCLFSCTDEDTVTWPVFVTVTLLRVLQNVNDLLLLVMTLETINSRSLLAVATFCCIITSKLHCNQRESLGKCRLQVCFIVAVVPTVLLTLVVMREVSSKMLITSFYTKKNVSVDISQPQIQCD